MAGPWMYHQTRRLVDDGHLGVGIDHPKLDAGLSLHLGGAGFG